MSCSKIAGDSEVNFNRIYRGIPLRVTELFSVKITSNEPPERSPRTGLRTKPSNFKLSTLAPKTARRLHYWNWLDNGILVSWLLKNYSIFHCDRDYGVLFKSTSGGALIS